MDEKQFIERTMALKGKMYAVCRSILRREADLEDAMQEAVLKAWMNLKKLKSPEFFETWLIRILINECKNLLKTRRHSEAELSGNEAAPPKLEDGLSEALDALDPKYRLAITLHYIAGYRVDEIGRMLKIPRGTVAWRLSQGRQLLKRNMGGHER